MKRCRCCKAMWAIESFSIARKDGWRRATCNACRIGCRAGTTAHKAKVRRRNRIAGSQRLVCQSCGLEWARPIKSGAPPQRCPSCKLANKRRTPPRWFVNRRVVLGPCRCQGCGFAVAWNGYAWEDDDGSRHRCAASITEVAA
jgi:predicted Zn-ribbon and HTH transcriptional regulator